MKKIYSLIFSVCFCFCAFANSDSGIEKYGVEKSQKSADVEWIKVIAKQDGRYMGWPSICCRSDGEILVVFSGDRDAHICPYGKLQMVRSSDDGKTWSLPETLVNTILDDRDAGIIELPNGNLLVAWFTSAYYQQYLKQAKFLSQKTKEEWQRVIDNMSDSEIDEVLGNWVIVSADNGRKWSKPRRTLGSAPHGPICLKDGRILYVGKAQDRRKDGGDDKIYVEESSDGGKTWKVISNIEIEKTDTLKDYHEPHAVEANDGRLIAQIRCHKDGYLRQSESVDGGKTWTVATKTPLQGYPSHLLKLKDGTIISVYGRRVDKFGEYASVSYDGGKTWDVKNEITLARADSSDLGYPASAQLADGSIITVFYQHSDTTKKEPTCIMATKWRLK